MKDYELNDLGRVHKEFNDISFENELYYNEKDHHFKNKKKSKKYSQRPDKIKELTDIDDYLYDDDEYEQKTKKKKHKSKRKRSNKYEEFDELFYE